MFIKNIAILVMLSGVFLTTTISPVIAHSLKDLEPGTAADVSISRSTERLVSAAIIQLIFSIAGMGLLYRTLSATQRANEHTQKIAEDSYRFSLSEMRAYLQVTGLNVIGRGTEGLAGSDYRLPDIENTNRKYCKAFHIHIKNTGKTPALDVSIESNGLIDETQGEQVHGDHNKIYQPDFDSGLVCIVKYPEAFDIAERRFVVTFKISYKTSFDEDVVTRWEIYSKGGKKGETEHFAAQLIQFSIN